jgi:hypothetical protein
VSQKKKYNSLASLGIIIFETLGNPVYVCETTFKHPHTFSRSFRFLSSSFPTLLSYSYQAPIKRLLSSLQALIRLLSNSYQAPSTLSFHTLISSSYQVLITLIPHSPIKLLPSSFPTLIKLLPHSYQAPSPLLSNSFPLSYQAPIKLLSLSFPTLLSSPFPTLINLRSIWCEVSFPARVHTRGKVTSHQLERWTHSSQEGYFRAKSKAGEVAQSLRPRHLPCVCFQTPNQVRLPMVSSTSSSKSFSRAARLTREAHSAAHSSKIKIPRFTPNFKFLRHSGTQYIYLLTHPFPPLDYSISPSLYFLLILGRLAKMQHISVLAHSFYFRIHWLPEC